MMDDAKPYDVVEALRTICKNSHYSQGFGRGPHDLVREDCDMRNAADTIEALRKENERLSSRIPKIVHRDLTE